MRSRLPVEPADRRSNESPVFLERPLDRRSASSTGNRLRMEARPKVTGAAENSTSIKLGNRFRLVALAVEQVHEDVKLCNSIFNPRLTHVKSW